MRVATLLPLAALIAAMAAGCLEKQPPQEMGSPDSSPGRVARGEGLEEGPVDTRPRPEVLYGRYIRGRALSPEPDPYELDGSGFSQGGYACEGLTVPVASACWSSEYTGAAQASHLAGDAVRVSFWLHGEPPPGSSVVLEVWLWDEGEQVAEGKSGPVTPTTGTPAPGPDGCTLAVVNLVLGADVAAGDVLSLVLRANDLEGSECDGGGKDGNRLEILTPDPNEAS